MNFDASQPSGSPKVEPKTPCASGAKATAGASGSGHLTLRVFGLFVGLAVLAGVGSSLLEASLVAFTLTIDIRGNGFGFVTINGPSITCPPTCVLVFLSGEPANLEAHVEGDSIFAGWGGNCGFRGTNSICRLTMNSNKFVTATFRPPRFPLSVIIQGDGSGRVTSSPAGINCSSQFGTITGTCRAFFEEDSSVTVMAQPDPGSNFRNWGNGDVCAGVTARTCSFSMPGAGSAVGPIFRINPVVFRVLSVQILGAGTGTVTSNPQNNGAINCTSGSSNRCTAFFPIGTLVALTATPTGGSTFGGWGGGCASAGMEPICSGTLNGDATVSATFNPPPTAAVALNGSGFHTGQTITYQATLTPGSIPSQVDIYLGCLLPDGKTFLSLVQASPGVISFALGSSPTPFLANVPLAPLAVPFSFTFTGSEPAGTYITYAGLVVAGSNPFQPANQLGLGIQAFQFTP